LNKYIALVGERTPPTAVKKMLSFPAVFDVVKLPFDTSVAPQIGDHPDTLLCIFGDTLYVHQSYARTAAAQLSYISEKCSLKLFTSPDERSASYPFDCGFNALVIPERNVLIGRKKSLATPLKALCSANINQGYAGCSALYADKTVITADPSILKAAESLSLPTLHISGNGISLPGYSEGFIGGAGGYIDKKLFLFGDIQTCDWRDLLTDFCTKRNIKIVQLEDSPLTDRGGIKFVEVKNL